MDKSYMEVNAYSKYNINDQEKEELLIEFGDAVRKYIHEGERTQQLDEFLKARSQIKSAYKKNLDGAAIIKEYDEIYGEIYDGTHLKIKATSTPKHVTTNKVKVHFRSLKGNDFQYNLPNSVICRKEKEDERKKLRQEMLEEWNRRLEQEIKDIAYLSHINMLYDLYEREKKLREEQKEYESISQQYQHLAKITKLLSEERKLELRQLENQLSIGDKELLQTIQDNAEFFNIKRGRIRSDNREVVKISLSPCGRKFNHYMVDEKHLIDKSMLNELVYKNGVKILDGIEQTCDNHFTRDLEFDGISPEYERALNSKYYSVSSRILANMKNMYDVSEYDDISDYKYVKNQMEDNEFQNETDIIYTGWNE